MRTETAYSDPAPFRLVPQRPKPLWVKLLWIAFALGASAGCLLAGADVVDSPITGGSKVVAVTAIACGWLQFIQMIADAVKS